MKIYCIVMIFGDGIGKEVVLVGKQVLEVLVCGSDCFVFEFEDFDWGVDYYCWYGVMMLVDGFDVLCGKDVILFGFVGDLDVLDYVMLWGLCLKICQGFDQYVNVCLMCILLGIDVLLKCCGLDDLNWVIVCENLEGEYVGVGGCVYQGYLIEVVIDVLIFMCVGVECIMCFVFWFVQLCLCKLLIVIMKSNVQWYVMVMWDEIVKQIVLEFFDVMWDKEFVDVVIVCMVNCLVLFDMIVVINLYVDIFSDFVVVFVGSFGIVLIGNIDFECCYLLMFELIYGFVFDIMGKGFVNLVGMFWLVVMLFEYFGEMEVVVCVMQVIEVVMVDLLLYMCDFGGCVMIVQVMVVVCECVVNVVVVV